MFDGYVVAVHGETAKPAGLGALVDDRTIVTCAHVVNLALGRPENAEPQPKGRLTVSWPRLATKRTVAATVAAWRPPATGDLAVLRVVDDHLPADVHPARLADDVPDPSVRLRVFGYPAGRPKG